MKKRTKYMRKKLGKLEREMLIDVSAGDLLYGMLVSGRNTKSFHTNTRKRAMHRQALARVIERMSKKGLLTKDSNDALALTKEGQVALESVMRNMRSKTKQDHPDWDQKWRLVAFDIPESIRGLRDTLRFVLKRAGFIQLQQSIWIHPYDSEELQVLLQEDERLKKSVIYVMVEHISNEQRLLQHFGLKRKLNNKI